MRMVTVDINQSIWDLAIQEYGDPSGVRQLLIDNPGLNFNDGVVAGSEVKITTDPLNKSIVDFLAKKGVKPSTAFNTGNYLTDENNDAILDETGDYII